MKVCEKCMNEKNICPKCMDIETEEEVSNKLNEKEQKKQDSEA